MAKGETGTSRQSRLAAALRDNLKRRKEQGRARKAVASGQPAGIAPAAAGHDRAADGHRADTPVLGADTLGHREDIPGAGGQRPLKED
ncbi:conserved hypothetical protein [Hyphomicrobiales bacterium]|nr:conserved hypothetical protein [Hyphomicrobiales bacterium]CAH1682757.1 conserved hypothetical protein [Hyphomicrobiales bacterium]